MPDKDGAGISGEFQPASDRDQAIEAARQEKMARIKAQLAAQHTAGRAPQSVSRVEQTALEENAAKPTRTLEHTPGGTTEKEVHQSIEQRRADRVAQIKDRLKQVSQERDLGQEFGRSHDEGR